MRRVKTLAGLACAAYAAVGSGCFLIPTNGGSISRYQEAVRAVPERAVRADGQILLHTRLIERPLGDEYLSRGLWAEAADPLPHETSALLAANGVRVGVISGVVPSELERLATSDAAVVNASLRSIRPDQPKPVPVNNSTGSVTVHVVRRPGEQSRELDWADPECAIVVTSVPTPDGRVRVRCEPRVQHSERRPHWGPTAEGTEFERRDQRPTEFFPSLGWEMSLNPHEVLVIGCVDGSGTDNLGRTLFLTRDPARPRQRVLAIQADFADSSASAQSPGVTGALAR